MAVEAAQAVAYAELHCEHDDELATFKGFGQRLLAAAHSEDLGEDRSVNLGAVLAFLRDREAASSDWAWGQQLAVAGTIAREFGAQP